MRDEHEPALVSEGDIEAMLASAERITRNANALVYVGPAFGIVETIGRTALKAWITVGYKTADILGIDTSDL
jgi:hypothetical protein